jgi:CRP/FNR family transcriptional regulator
LWSRAPRSVVEELFAQSELCTYASGETVLSADSTNHFLVVITGRVRTSRSDPRGHELSFASAGPSEPLAIVQAIQGKALGSHFLATEPSLVALVPVGALQTAIAAHPDISYDMALMFSQRFEVLLDFLMMLGADVHCRLASFILARADERPEDAPSVELGMSRRELASRLGTVPETLSRAFAKLRDDGLVETEGRRRVLILNHEALRELQP